MINPNSLEMISRLEQVINIYLEQKHYSYAAAVEGTMDSIALKLQFNSPVKQFQSILEHHLDPITYDQSYNDGYKLIIDPRDADLDLGTSISNTFKRNFPEKIK